MQICVNIRSRKIIFDRKRWRGRFDSVGTSTNADRSFRPIAQRRIRLARRSLHASEIAKARY